MAKTKNNVFIPNIGELINKIQTFYLNSFGDMVLVKDYNTIGHAKSGIQNRFYGDRNKKEEVEKHFIIVTESVITKITVYDAHGNIKDVYDRVGKLQATEDF